MKLHHNTVHIPDRSTWRCATDQAPWPCERRQAELVQDSDGTLTGLRIVMMGYFEQAVQDLPSTPAGDLYTQTNGWIDRYTTSPKAGGGEPS